MSEMLYIVAVLLVAVALIVPQPFTVLAAILCVVLAHQEAKKDYKGKE